MKCHATPLAGVLACIVLFVDVGCSTGEPGPSSRPQPAITATVRDRGQLSLPLDAYDLSGEEKAVVHRAGRRFLVECMKSFGLELTVPPVVTTSYPPNAQMLGWLGERQVERYGYAGAPGLADQINAASSGGNSVMVVTEAQLPVFNGTVAVYAGRKVPDGGCSGELDRRLTANAATVTVDPKDPGILPEQGIDWLRSQAIDHGLSDGRYRAVVAAWSRCMRDAGLDYAEPDRAETDPDWGDPADPETRTVSAEEIRVATADQRCRLAVNYSGVLLALVSANENQIITTRRPTVLALQRLLRTRLENARRLDAAA